jgi:predicted amidohydrolase
MENAMTDHKQQTFRAGIIQMRSSRKIEDNLIEANKLIRDAAGKGAQYILTPENTAQMELEPELVKLHAQLFEQSSILANFRALARELKIWLHIGSVSIRLGKSDHHVNRSCLISPKGAITAYYDKIHLFDVDLPNGETYRESDSVEPGNKAVLSELSFGNGVSAKLGFSICYDVRFPSLYRVLAKAGAQILTVPAAFTQHTGQAHWHTLLRARAIETGCYVFAAAQGGTHDNGRATFGHSLIISPWGEVMSEAGTDPQILLTDIDLARVHEARTRIPSLTHDRPFEVVVPSKQSVLEDAS